MSYFNTTTTPQQQPSKKTQQLTASVEIVEVKSTDPNSAETTLLDFLNNSQQQKNQKDNIQRRLFVTKPKMISPAAVSSRGDELLMSDIDGHGDSEEEHEEKQNTMVDGTTTTIQNQIESTPAVDIKVHSGYMSLREAKLGLWLKMTLEDNMPVSQAQALLAFIGSDSTTRSTQCVYTGTDGRARSIRIDIAQKSNDSDGLIVGFVVMTNNTITIPEGAMIIQNGNLVQQNDNNNDQLIIVPESVDVEDIAAIVPTIEEMFITQPTDEFRQHVGYM